MSWRIVGLIAWVLITTSGCSNDFSAPTLFGHAVFDRATDHAGIEVSLPRFGRSTLTDSYGYFFFRDVPAGVYDVVASHPGSLERQAVTRVVHTTGATPMFMTLSPIGRVTGTVISMSGQPIVGATVSALGTDASTVSVEGGAFVLDPAPAGAVTFLASARSFESGDASVRVPVGGEAQVELTLSPRVGPDPFARNLPPEIGVVQLAAEVDDRFPRPVPLVNTSDGVVRRRGLYRLSTETSDPDGDPVRVFWSADRGTIAQAPGETAALWTAGRGVSTIIGTAVDPFGGTATTRLVVESSGDSIRGGDHHQGTVYFAERRDGDFNIYSYNLETGIESVVDDDPQEQHAPSVVGNWLVYGDSEFVFIGTLTFRIAGLHLSTGERFRFGQTFGNDDVFISRFDAYSPLQNPAVPYFSSSAAIAPPGYGYYDLDGQRPIQPPGFVSPGAQPPASIRTLDVRGDTQVWVSQIGELWVGSDSTASSVVADLGVSPGGRADLQVSGNIAAFLPNSSEPLLLLDLGSPFPAPRTVGFSVMSFAVTSTHVAWVEQGPSSADVFIEEVSSGNRRQVTQEPYFARRIWNMDSEYLIWGDQGVEGQTFVETNTELLWVDRVD